MPRLAIIHPEANFNNNPNLLGLVEMLSESGYQIDLYGQYHEGIDQNAPCPGVSVTLTTVPARYAGDTPVVLPSIAAVDPLTAARSIAIELPRPDLIIGVDRGIIEAAALGGVWGIPVGLISYEIWFGDETSREFKAPEIAACKHIAFAVCQDMVRGLALCAENEISENKLIEIPVAGRGVRRANRSKAIHAALGLDPTTKILLYMGELSSNWSGIDEILTSTAYWPLGWVLLLHHRYGGDRAKELSRRARLGSRGNVFISPFQTLPASQLCRLLTAVDVGVAFYRPKYDHPSSGKNLAIIGMASGKFSTYLQHGVPVIVNELGEMSSHVRTSGLGRVVSRASEIPSVLEDPTFVDDGLNSERCYKFFEERLDCNVRGQRLIAKLKELLA